MRGAGSGTCVQWGVLVMGVGAGTHTLCREVSHYSVDMLVLKSRMCAVWAGVCWEDVWVSGGRAGCCEVWARLWKGTGGCCCDVCEWLDGSDWWQPVGAGDPVCV